MGQEAAGAPPAAGGARADFGEIPRGVTAAEVITEAARVLRSGGLVAFPTETVYGLGGDASNPEAVKKIYAAKGRPRNHPLIVHVYDHDALRAWVRDVPPVAQCLVEHFWPGPLTLIFKRAAGVLDLVTGGQDTIALRIPSHPIARALLKAFGGGVAAPSANRYGRISATTAAHVRAEFGSAVDCVLDGGASDLGIESTIVDVSTGHPVLLRPGSITQADIERAGGEAPAAAGAGSPRAPGTLPKHYAPQTPLMLVEPDLLIELATSMTRHGGKVAVLSRSVLRPVNDAITWVSAPPDAAGYTHDLYANLRALDEAGCVVILVEQPPVDPDWVAVQDRLTRAAAGAPPPDAT